jgi:hypothetical protein
MLVPEKVEGTNWRKFQKRDLIISVLERIRKGDEVKRIRWTGNVEHTG